MAVSKVGAASLVNQTLCEKTVVLTDGRGAAEREEGHKVSTGWGTRQKMCRRRGFRSVIDVRCAHQWRREGQTMTVGVESHGVNVQRHMALPLLTTSHVSVQPSSNRSEPFEPKLMLDDEPGIR